MNKKTLLGITFLVLGIILLPSCGGDPTVAPTTVPALRLTAENEAPLLTASTFCPRADADGVTQLSMEPLPSDYGWVVIPLDVANWTIRDEHPEALTYRWSNPGGGPGEMSFLDDTAPQTQACIQGLPGEYTVQLTVSDGEFEASNITRYTVEPFPGGE